MDDIAMRTTLTPEEKAFFKKFGERLAAFRKARGLTQAQLAEILGDSQQRIMTFEKGVRRMPLSDLPGVAKALGVSVEELLGIKSHTAKPGPTPLLQKQLERLSRLPRSRQRFVSEMLEGYLQRTG